MANYTMVDVKRAPCDNPFLYISACCCFPCVACIHRMDVLKAQSKWPEDYKCCQDSFADLHEKLVFFPKWGPEHPYVCLCLESLIIPGAAYGGSRFQMNQDYHISDRPFEAHCGKVLLCSYLCCGPIACVWALWFDACLFVQQDHELHKQGKNSTMCCKLKE